MEINDCVATVTQLMREWNISRAQIEQLAGGLESRAQGYYVQFEKAIATTVTSSAGGVIEINRKLDEVARTLFEERHTETKTGYKSIGDALDFKELRQDAGIAIKNLQDRLSGQTAALVENVWRIADHEFKDRLPVSIQNNMTKLHEELKGKFTGEELAAAMRFKFVDAAKNVITTELDANGKLIFKDGMDRVFGADGLATQTATKAASSSPNFMPAMEALFGSSGKVAHAAQEATGATNLDAAMQGLEQKVESGVTTALDEAGTKAQAHAASKLGANIKEGVGALGNTLSSIGGLGTQVLALGDAWNKPKKGAADYFNLMGQLGGTISQGLGAVDAIGKLGTAMSSLGIMTKIAAAAQAVFNAIMAVNPVVLIVIAVVALIAAIVLLIVYWDQVKAALRDNPWLTVAAAMFGIIGLIILVIAYWDEIKLAVLIAANFMSIQLQKIGGFFVGLKTLIGMVWDWIVNSVYNLGAGILNIFIEFGAGITNTFIDLLNGFIDIYNDIAAWVPGLDEIANVEKVDVEAMKVATKAVPEIDVGKAFAQQGEITGGLEDQIAKQEQVVQKAQDEDRARQQKAAASKAEEERKAAAEAPAGAPAGAPALPAGFGGAPAATGEAPAIPAGALGAGAGPDQSVHVEGGIHVTINAEGLDGGSARMLTDDMVRQIQERLDSLRSERDRRVGVRTAVAA